MGELKARVYNILTSLTMLVVSLIGWISIQGERVSDLTKYAILAAVTVSGIMLIRTAFSALMLHLDEKRNLDVTATEEEDEPCPDKLTEIAVATKRERFVVENYLDWISGPEGRRIIGDSAILAKITDAYDGDGNEDGYWLCYIGTRRAYHQLKEELSNATVTDCWPNPFGPGEGDDLMDEYEEVEDDDAAEPLAEDLPGDGN